MMSFLVASPLTMAQQLSVSILPVLQKTSISLSSPRYSSSHENKLPGRRERPKSVLPASSLQCGLESYLFCLASTASGRPFSTELGFRHSVMQLRAMKRRWRAAEESLGKILVGTLLVFKLDIMDRNSEYKVVKQVLRALFCPK